jgi:hypothetical protein
MRQYDQAQEQSFDALEIDPNFAAALGLLIIIYAQNFFVVVWY